MAFKTNMKVKFTQGVMEENLDAEWGIKAENNQSTKHFHI